MSIASEVIKAIEKELRDSKRPYCFHVKNCVEEPGEEWRLIVEPADERSASALLTDAFYESDVYLSRSGVRSRKIGSLQACDPELCQIELKAFPNLTEPLHVGDNIRLYETPYAQSVLEAWKQADLAKYSEDRFRTFSEMQLDSSSTVQISPSGRTLNVEQYESYSLLNLELGFLWGPPGTGKTTTLGEMLADLLMQSDERVLLIAPSNSAVDQALVSIDKALDKNFRLPKQLRRNLIGRVGNNYHPRFYENREHLLPIENERPLGVVRSMDKSRLIALTSSAAIFPQILSALQKRAPFDRLVIDEGSQMSLAHFLPLSTLAKRVLVTGDPKQLPPVCKFDDIYSKRWIGRSPFHFCKEKNFVRLNEQYRMMPDICDYVSALFYDGDLRTSGRFLTDEKWLKERDVKCQTARYSCPLQRHFTVMLLPELEPWEKEDERGWSNKFKSPYRHQSRKIILDLIRELLANNQSPNQICAITPFRAQSFLLKRDLESVGLENIRVATAHKAQGEEVHTVIFDPVSPTSGFLSDELGDQLINVAISRAKARFILLLTHKDLKAISEFSKERGSSKEKNRTRFFQIYQMALDRGQVFDLAQNVFNQPPEETNEFLESVLLEIRSGKRDLHSMIGFQFESKVLKQGGLVLMGSKQNDSQIVLRDSKSGKTKSIEVDTISATFTKAGF